MEASFLPRQLYPEENDPCTDWIGGWLDPRGGLHAVAKRKISALDGNRKPAVKRWQNFNNVIYIKTFTFITLLLLWLFLRCIRSSKAVPLHAMEALGGKGELFLLVLDLGTWWGWVVSVTPWPRFTPGERTPGTHRIGSWVGPRISLDAEARGKSSAPAPDRTPVVQSVVRHYTNCM
jgi:hypothetical protein